MDNMFYVAPKILHQSEELFHHEKEPYSSSSISNCSVCQSTFKEHFNLSMYVITHIESSTHSDPDFAVSVFSCVLIMALCAVDPSGHL